MAAVGVFIKNVRAIASSTVATTIATAKTRTIQTNSKNFKDFKLTFNQMSKNGFSNALIPIAENVKELGQDTCAAPQLTNETFGLFLLALVFLIFGIYYLTCGYRFFRATIFSVGFNLATAAVYAICFLKDIVPLYCNVILSICAGLLFGLVTMLIEYVGIFVSGQKAGLLNGIFFLTVYNISVQPITLSPWTKSFIIISFGVVGAFLNLYYKKGMTIVSTSVYGSAMIMISFDYFLNGLATLKWIFERLKMRPAKGPMCPYSWLLLSLWVIGVILGIIIQWLGTGTGIHHKDDNFKKRRSKNAATRMTRSQRADLYQKKYRYLYQVRTAHGDVISQSYIQAQKKSNSDPWQAGVGGEFNTLQSDSTHLSVLASEPHPDSEDDFNQIRACQ